MVARLLLPDLTPVAEVLIAHQLTIDLAETITHVDRVILVDAVADLPPGEVQVYVITPEDGALDMSHYVTPGALLLAAEVLYGRSPAAVMVGIGASHFYGEGLTAPVEAAVDEAARLIREMLSD